MLIAIKGCNGGTMHKAVQYNRCDEGTSIYICADCGEEFIENEDSGCGG